MSPLPRCPLAHIRPFSSASKAGIVSSAPGPCVTPLVGRLYPNLGPRPLATCVSGYPQPHLSPHSYFPLAPHTARTPHSPLAPCPTPPPPRPSSNPHFSG